MSPNPWWKQSYQNNSNSNKTKKTYSEYQHLASRTEIKRKLRPKFDFKFSSSSFTPSSDPHENEDKNDNDSLSFRQFFQAQSINDGEEKNETAERARLKALKITQLIELGLSQYQNKDYAQASQTFEQAISLEFTNPEANYWLGSIYLQQQKLVEAEKCFFQACGEDGYVEAQYWLGVIAQEEERLADAGKYYSSFLKLSPRNLLAEKAASELNEIKFRLLFG